MKNLVTCLSCFLFFIFIYFSSSHGRACGCGARSKGAKKKKKTRTSRPPFIFSHCIWERIPSPGAPGVGTLVVHPGEHTPSPTCLPGRSRMNHCTNLCVKVFHAVVAKLWGLFVCPWLPYTVGNGVYREAGTKDSCSRGCKECLSLRL